MPLYELCLILRPMNRTELFDSLRRAGKMIYEHKGLISKIENLGTRQLPFKMSGHYGVQREGSTFVFNFYSPGEKLDSMRETLKRDVDVYRARIHTAREPLPHQCTLENELLPAPYRKEVQEMIKEGRKPARKYDSQTGLDFYPFQR